MPSGRKSLSAIRPLGSSRAAWSAEIRALLIRSFTWEWRGCLPADFLQHRPCLPKESTLVPQIQVCWWHRCEPKRRPQAMRRLELSNFRPSEDTGIAVSQSDEFGADMALSLATSVSFGASLRRWSNFVWLNGMSQADCKLELVGRLAPTALLCHSSKAESRYIEFSWAIWVGSKFLTFSWAPYTEEIKAGRATS